MRDIDLTDARIFEPGFPHEIFATLRAESPVHWQAFAPEFPGERDPGFWVFSRYEDVQAASRDAELFCSYDGPTLSILPAEMRGTMLVSMDGRDHARQRRLISAGFTPRMVGQLEAQAREWTVAIVEKARERGTCDFVDDVAYQLPMHMIADIVGIPVEDREWLFGLTKELLQAGDDAQAASPEDFLAIQVQMFEYAQELGRRKRSDPQDDVWTILSTVEVETDDGERTELSGIELDMFFFVLTIAGSETTRNAIAGGLDRVARPPRPARHAPPRTRRDATRRGRDPPLDLAGRLLRTEGHPRHRSPRCSHRQR